MSPASTTSPRRRSSDAKRGASVHKGPDRMFASSTSVPAGRVSARSWTCTCGATPFARALARAAVSAWGSISKQCTCAAAIVDNARTGREVRIEPRQAQRRARMTAGAEGQPRIERHHDRAGLADALMVWAYPQTLPEAQRVKVLEPLALPDALGQLLRADEGGVQ